MRFSSDCSNLRRGLFAALAAALFAVVPLAAASPAELPLSPCTLDGGLVARCGTFVVPEDRGEPGGRRISLRVVVVPARGGPVSPDPIVHIAGGPGGSSVADALGVVSTFSRVNERRDLVFVDQRGTGGSNRLECPRPSSATVTPAAVRAYVRACLGKLDADPRQYATAPAMDDLAEVVRALGYSRVNIYGGSYGATAAQYFLVQHAELVRTVILDGGTLLDIPIFERWAPNGQRALRSILERCAGSRACKERYPRVRREIFEVMAALRRKPARLRGRLIRPAAAADAIQRLSRSPAGAAQIPRLAHRARLRDWTPLAKATVSFGEAPDPVQVMYLSIVCNEPWARRDPKRVAAAGRATYLAEATKLEASLVAAACSEVPKAEQPAWSRARVRSDKPVLLTVGGADPQDPPSNVSNAARELPSSRPVTVPAGGHGVIQLGCMPRIAESFIERGTASGLDTRCVARYSPPSFR